MALPAKKSPCLVGQTLLDEKLRIIHGYPPLPLGSIARCSGLAWDYSTLLTVRSVAVHPLWVVFSI
jgi:hypothetical protein